MQAPSIGLRATLLPGMGPVLSLPANVGDMKETPVKHLKAMSKLPDKADDFTTGQKLTLAAGIVDAVASFLGTKEDTGGNEET